MSFLQNIPRRVHFISSSIDGHRHAYKVALSHALRDERVLMTDDRGAASTMFFMMIDDHVARFVFCSILNAIRGRRTVGLFFRPGECFRRDKIKYRLKHILFMFAKRIPSTTILTILPFDVDERFSQIANGWIHDPQLWDLRYFKPTTTPHELSDYVYRRANDRTIVIALGTQNRIKAFDFFTRLWARSPDIRERFLFVAAGKVSNDLKSNAERFESAGGLLIDRFISDEELFGFYQISDVIWSCYAENYNQASGIFGRAFQFGKPTIIRDGSFLVPLAKKLAHPILAVSCRDIDSATRELLAWAPETPNHAELEQKLSEIHRRDMKILIGALSPAADGHAV